MPAQTTDLFPLQDLEDSSRTGDLADSDLKALHTVADWIKTSAALDPCVPLRRRAWNARHFGSPRSRSPAVVISDWMFFLENDDWLSVWAGRFGGVRPSRPSLRNYAALTGG